MEIAPGARLGPYEIVSRIGAGGMGEVWRGRDSRLGRSVAIKVLPKEFAQDKELRRRFEREARIISQLNHPNICTLHDVGEGYLVMEFLEGESLAERLRKGPLPVRDALKLGSEIALALDQAHRAGVVHRDLKPGNVMVTKVGAKLLDFGLARSEAQAGVEDRTVTAPLTETGVILGTVPYMAPEQLEAKPADARTDIFALGAVLYEMITGQRAFQGASRASLIARILNAEPAPISSHQPLTPRSLEHLITRCLAKDPDERWQSAKDLAGELRWIAESLSGESVAGAVAAPRSRRAAIAVALILGGLLLGGVAGWFGRSKTAGVNGPQRIPRLVRLTWDMRSGDPAISPDGNTIAYTGTVSDDTDAKKDIFVKRIGGENATNLTKGSGADNFSPAFSPDGQRIAFQVGWPSSTGIFVMGATGESLRRLTPSGFRPAWSPDGKTIAFSSLYAQGSALDAISSLWVVDIETGTTRKVYDGDAVRPFWSPSGKRIGFDGRRKGMAGDRALSTISVTGGEPVEVATTPGIGWMSGIWTPGSIWYANPETGPPGIWRVLADEDTGKTVSPAEPVLRSTQEVWPHFSSTPNGSRIVFRAVSRETDLLRWEVDPVSGAVSGGFRKVLPGFRPLYRPIPSPDRRWIAGRLIEQSNEFREDLAIVSEASGEIRRLTDDAFRESQYDWSPDGSWLYFCVALKDGSELWRIRPDGSGRERVIGETPAGEVLNILVSPDGEWLYVEGGKKHEPFLAEAGANGFRFDPLPAMSGEKVFAALSWSADGRWFAGRARNPEGNLDDQLVLYDLAGKRYRALDRVKIEKAVCFLPDSRRLLMVTRAGGVTVLDIESGATQPGGSILPNASEVSISRDGKTLFASRNTHNGDIWMLDFTEGPRH
ncbi:MAG: protein kinase [Thermoanaerobaculia bacterium]|nr:protein kinase [Thermoanaerobaculia bacterium]